MRDRVQCSDRKCNYRKDIYGENPLLPNCSEIPPSDPLSPRWSSEHDGNFKEKQYSRNPYITSRKIYTWFYHRVFYGQSLNSFHIRFSLFNMAASKICDR